MGRPLDRRAVDQLVVEHLPVALRFALRLTHDAVAADDIVQEALCRVLRQWRSYRGEAPFRTWMLSIVVNVDRDRRRRLRETEPIAYSEFASTQATPPELAAATELQDAVRAAVDCLPGRQREVALLAWGESLPASEIAAVLQITEASVYTNLHFARQRVAAAIGLEPIGRERT